MYSSVGCASYSENTVYTPYRDNVREQQFGMCTQGYNGCVAAWAGVRTERFECTRILQLYELVLVDKIRLHWLDDQLHCTIIAIHFQAPGCGC